MTSFVEIAREVYQLRYPVLDVNATLVVGAGAALVVDTLSTQEQGRALREAVRLVTHDPVVVVNTHHHFDHCFGNVVFDGSDVWAADETARLLRENAPALQRQWYSEWTVLDAELAVGLAAVDVRPPNRTVQNESTVDVGGRTVLLRHPGRGHTAGDLVVRVSDVDVLITGDLVESSGPPSFEDAYPLEWPETVANLLAMASSGTVVVPGHGPVVDTEFVRTQHSELAALEWLIRDGHADGALAADVAAKAPFGPPAALTAVRRGYAELAGRI